MKEKVSLYEVLVKTSYSTLITEPKDKNLTNPVGFGSGFIVEYENHILFVTADHTVHIDDYNEGFEQRTWKDYKISVINNNSDPYNFLSTGIEQLNGFYSMEEFNLEKPDDMPKLVDVSVCLMIDDNLKLPFLTKEVKFQNGEIIKAGEHKFQIKKECFSEAKTNINYFIFGKIRTRLIDNIRIESEHTLKESLKFICRSGDYLLFNTPNLIHDKEDWVGLSGSPVISEEGDCVGVLCSVRENSRSIWVMPISKVKMLIEVAICQEKIKDNQKNIHI